MTDLSALFPAEDGRRRQAIENSEGNGALSDLVGTPEVEHGSPRASSAPSLRALVGDAPEAAHTSAVDLGDGAGGSRVSSGSRASGRDLSTLVARGATHATEGGWATPESATVGQRRLFNGVPRVTGFTLLSSAVAVAAVLSVVVVASLAIHQRMTVSPAHEAMLSLVQSEAQLENETKVLETAAVLFDASAKQAMSLTEAAAPVLAGVEVEVDPTVWGSADASRNVLSTLAATPLPVNMRPYERPSFDETSLAEVGAAIEQVRLARAALPEEISEVRVARETLVTALNDFRARLRDVAIGLESGAISNADANRAAASSFRVAVTDAADRLRVAVDLGGNALAEMSAYKAALDELRAENSRVLGLRASTGADAPRTSVPPTGGVAPQPTTPDPAAPDPATPTEPVPSDSPSSTPQPVDPSA